MRACRLSMVTLIILFFCLTTFASLSANIWLSKWTDQAKIQVVRNYTSSISSSQIRNLNIYAVLGIAQGIFNASQ
jgi:hypothetical protein